MDLGDEMTKISAGSISTFVYRLARVWAADGLRVRSAVLRLSRHL